MNGMSEDKDTPAAQGSKYGTYTLPTQGDDITEQVNQLKPEFKAALPAIGGLLQNLGYANGAAISSGGRTAAHQMEINPNAPNSYHVIRENGGDAVDIVLPDGTTNEQGEAVAKAFADTGAFAEAQYENAGGSGYHLHLGGYNGSLSSGKGGTATTTTKYSQAEIENMASMSDQYEAQDKRQQQIANDNLVKQGQLEMMQLHSQGISDPSQYQVIVEKYGANNPSVYATLRGSMGTFGAVAIRTSGRSGGSNGGSGSGSRGAGGRDTVTNIKSLIGTDFKSYQDIVDYCNTNGIALSSSEQISLNKAMEDYRNGTGEFKPEYNVSADDIASTGVEKDTFEHQMPVVQQLTRQWAVQFKDANGREPNYNELREAASGFVTTDSGNPGSQVDYRSAGIDTTADVGDGYTRIFWTDNTSSDYPTYIAKQIIDGSLTRNDVENGNYD